ncbi:hypothetical protein [uncultured Martelella sp.]|uniref:hypothetical protein n=1 Tax=uncultured Martelella sp. TaxID=392331 RepID=UPI0029C93C4F|nr:hypothetical protein [uncultured Martelella sp.]
MNSGGTVRQKSASLEGRERVLEIVSHSRRLADKLGPIDPDFEQKRFSDFLSDEENRVSGRK